MMYYTSIRDTTTFSGCTPATAGHCSTRQVICLNKIRVYYYSDVRVYYIIYKICILKYILWTTQDTEYWQVTTYIRLPIQSRVLYTYIIYNKINITYIMIPSHLPGGFTVVSHMKMQIF